MAQYWACVLFCRRWLGQPGQAEKVHFHAVERIIHNLPDLGSWEETQYRRRLARFAWPMFMAAIETTNCTSRSLLLERLHEVRNVSAECQWSWSAAEAIIKLQNAADRPWVDLTPFMQCP
jgi:hypothetical protein